MAEGDRREGARRLEHTPRSTSHVRCLKGRAKYLGLDSSVLATHRPGDDFRRA